MAVIWAKTVNDTHFEVRRAGRSVRLYTNGVFHSQYNPANPVTATVWNLLLLPAFFRPAGAIRQVLVLGVGGGAVIRLLDRFVAPGHIIGVDLNATHLYVARRFFGITQTVADLVEADAVDWLHRYSGPRFDLIIDDLFGEQGGEPVRTVAADRDWLGILSRNLAEDGVLVMNFVGTRMLRETCRTLHHAGPGHSASAFRLSLPGYENAVGAFIRQPAEARHLRERLRATGLPDGMRLSRLPFRIQRIPL